MNQILNLSNISFQNPILCLSAKGYNINCIKANFCPQFSAYARNAGIAVILAYIALSWLDYWLQSKDGLEVLLGPEQPDYYLSLGWFCVWLPLDCSKQATKTFWHSLVMGTAAKALLIFAAVIVYLNW